ncbi:MAG: squalene/phytoene synthase family protein [Ectothiorhodospiraceae bacterium]|nr:squalene/phytoene synthase family protein [Ectothiorhodospiraceae bacterium]
MDPIQYCHEKAAPPGSGPYYAIRMAPAEARPGLLAAHAYHTEVMAIPVEVSDQGVASVKLNWWREELDRALRGQARHPVGRLLQEAIRRHELPEQPLRHILDAAAMDLEYGTYPSFRELTVYCHHSGGALAHLLVAVCGYRDRGSLDFAHDLGMALTLDAGLRNLRRDAHAGRVYLPQDEMRQAGVDRTALLQHGTSPPLRRLLAEQAARVEQFFDQAEQRLPPEDRHRQRSQLVLAALARALLREMREDDFPLLEQAYDMTPIRKLWIAWRTARRAR